MWRTHLLLLTLLVGFSVFAQEDCYAAATMTVINNDPPGQGFNDPTPAAPVGGNAGNTIGAQRLIAFQYAVDIWAALITSPVPIRIVAGFSPLDCDPTSAVLAHAGPTSVLRDFAGAPLVNTWYVQALANSLNGSDLDPDDDDMEAEFNSNIGTPGCLTGSGWYYGLDGNSPPDQIDFVSVLLHEIGHGLGFLSLVSLSSGAKFLNANDAYMVHLEDHTLGKTFPEMTSAQRYDASRRTGNLHWTGANAVLGPAALNAGQHPSGHVEMYAPNPARSGSSVSHFSTTVAPNELMEPSYTAANHDVGLALELLADLGWNVSIPVVDVFAPGKIKDLQGGNATLTSVELSWTAPGGNGYVGTATAYDLRVSSAPIKESNWAAASPLTGEPAPAAAGTLESVSINGLLCGRSYYFAIKTADDSANTSSLSNVIRKRTLACPKLTVSPLPQTQAVVGTSYNQSFSISGGVAPYTVQLLSGLPEAAGLSLAAQTVSGTPTEAKTWRFRVLVTDQIGSSAKKSFAVRIRPPS
ncbi:MAG TPA: putative Ig domain-containing protein [Candidatus Binatia bacterium]|nr:putative Ig domain-containing protein [Candidatus Binatia bacterium]